MRDHPESPFLDGIRAHDRAYIEDQGLSTERLVEILGSPAEAVSASVTASSPDWHPDTADASDAAPDDATQELRRALHRLSTELRVSRDALTRALADIGDLMEMLR